MMTSPVQLTPEARGLLERLIQERDAAASRLDVALLAMKTAMGVPVEWTIRSLDVGFIAPESETGVLNHGSNN